MKYLSVCSGIEAASVAWRPLGWEAVAFAEIEPFPREVLAHRFTAVPNLGDITKYKEWKIDQSIDLLVGGTPCQSFSITGKREGLDDPRGQLMFSYLGILERFQPRWCVWENVPGVLSSGNGLDFAEFLSELEKRGYGWAYRVLDAQYFGVPQRRRRVFVVGYLGDFNPAAKVLFESESLRGNTAQGRKTREEIAKHLMAGANKQDPELENFICDMRGNGDGITAPTLTGDHAGRPTDYTPIVGCFMAGAGAKAGSTAYSESVSPTLKAAGSGNNCSPSIHNAGTVRRLTPRECERLQGFPDDWTLIPYRGKPAECCPDTPRYKAIGNSMAVPVMRWIGERIQLVEGEINGR